MTEIELVQGEDGVYAMPEPEPEEYAFGFDFDYDPDERWRNAVMTMIVHRDPPRVSLLDVMRP